MRSCDTCYYATGINKQKESLGRLADCLETADKSYCAIHRVRMKLEELEKNCPMWDEIPDDTEATHIANN